MRRKDQRTLVSLNDARNQESDHDDALLLDGTTPAATIFENLRRTISVAQSSRSLAALHSVSGEPLIDSLIQQIDHTINTWKTSEDPIYGKLLNWYDIFWYYGIGLAEHEERPGEAWIFDFQDFNIVSKKTDLRHGQPANHIARAVEGITYCSAPDHIIERLKVAVRCFFYQKSALFNVFSWNCEHAARLVATNHPICYQIKESPFAGFFNNGVNLDLLRVFEEALKVFAPKSIALVSDECTSTQSPIETVIYEIDKIHLPEDPICGKLLNWYDWNGMISHYGIGLAQNEVQKDVAWIFDPADFKVFTKKTSQDSSILPSLIARPVADTKYCGNPKYIIERLKIAVRCFFYWKYSLFSWNCEHSARLVATNNPICYQISENPFGSFFNNGVNLDALRVFQEAQTTYSSTQPI